MSLPILTGKDNSGAAEDQEKIKETIRKGAGQVLHINNRQCFPNYGKQADFWWVVTDFFFKPLQAPLQGLEKKTVG